MIDLVITGKPLSVNKTYRTTRNRGIIFLSKEAKAYGEEVVRQAREQYKDAPLDCWLEVTYFYYFDSKRRMDHLNFNKLLNDKLNNLVWVDDRQILISSHYTMYDKNNPRIEINIKPIYGLEKNEPRKK